MSTQCMTAPAPDAHWLMSQSFELSSCQGRTVTFASLLELEVLKRVHCLLYCSGTWRTSESSHAGTCSLATMQKWHSWRSNNALPKTISVTALFGRYPMIGINRIDHCLAEYVQRRSRFPYMRVTPCNFSSVHTAGSECPSLVSPHVTNIPSIGQLVEQITYEHHSGIPAVGYGQGGHQNECRDADNAGAGVFLVLSSRGWR